MRTTYYVLVPQPPDASYSYYIAGVSGKNSRIELGVWLFKVRMGSANIPFGRKSVAIRRCTKDFLPKDAVPDSNLSTERVKFYATPERGIGGEGI